MHRLHTWLDHLSINNHIKISYLDGNEERDSQYTNWLYPHCSVHRFESRHRHGKPFPMIEYREVDSSETQYHRPPRPHDTMPIEYDISSPVSNNKWYHILWYSMDKMQKGIGPYRWHDIPSFEKAGNIVGPCKWRAPSCLIRRAWDFLAYLGYTDDIHNW